VRARESRRSDRLFDDPYAAALVAAAGGAGGAGDGAGDGPAEDVARDVAGASPQRRALAFHIVIRTRYYDDFLLDAASAGGCRQVVLLAAGLDARAFRLRWPPGTSVFELDLPPVLTVKDEALAQVDAQPSCVRVVVPVDLRGDWGGALGGAGLDPTEPTVWLAEGLLVYLDAAAAEQLLATVSDLAAPGSRLAFERGTATHRLVAADTEAVTRLWQRGMHADVLAWLRDHGWECGLDRLDDVAARYGRPPSRSTDGGFVHATRRMT